MSKFSDFLEKNNIDTRQLVSTSRKLERLRPEDRKIRMAKKRVKTGDAKDHDKELAQKKPRSGRHVTHPTLRAAMQGERLTRKARGRITRAVNEILKKKNKGEAQPSDLFGA
jgi:hypothetical protein